MSFNISRSINSNAANGIGYDTDTSLLNQKVVQNYLIIKNNFVQFTDFY